MNKDGGVTPKECWLVRGGKNQNGTFDEKTETIMVRRKLGLTGWRGGKKSRGGRGRGCAPVPISW